jgi:hypothetical protein
MHPLVSIFVRLTLALAVAIGLFMVLTFLFGAIFKVLIVAGLLAALILGGVFLYNAVFRRKQLPVIR